MKKNKSKRTDDISYTRNIVWRATGLSSSYKDKKTTFVELFFDLAVVFVFGLLANKFMSTINLTTEQILSPGGTIVHHSQKGIAVWFWVVNFFALWLTWYQYTDYIKYFGKDSIRGHAIMFALIMTLVLQGAGFLVREPFMSHYSLLVSFICARFIFLFATGSSLWVSRQTKIKEIQIKKWKVNFKYFIFTALMFVVYIILVETSTIHTDIYSISNPEYNSPVKTNFDPWIFELATSVLLSISIFVHSFTQIRWDAKEDEFEFSMNFHTKERHHLFVIISLGEVLVVTLTSGALDSEFVFNTQSILYMFATPMFALFIWYTYKEVVYKTKPKESKRNHYLFVFVHIAYLIGALLILASIKSAMTTRALIDSRNSTHFIETIGKSNFVAYKEHMGTLYSSVLQSGITIALGSLTIYMWAIQLKNSRWTHVVNSTKYLYLVTSLLLLVWTITSTVLEHFGIQQLFWIDVAVFTTGIFIFMFISTFLMQKAIKQKFSSMSEYNEYISKLDH